MKFSVGLPQIPGSFLSSILENTAHIREVYFSWGDFPNGRSSQLHSDQLAPWQLQGQQEEALQSVSDQGIPLNLLFNATCYGEDSQSRAFFHKIGQTVEYIGNRYGLESVTTTSPLIAKFIKANFPEVHTRASVNMRIGTVQGMDYLGRYFDSYYMQREYNRDFARIAQLSAWCRDNGKTLHILANSGCLNHCSAHTFHDNLVAHEAEISQMDNGYAFEGICVGYLKKPENHRALIENTSFIRPEDIPLYEGIFPAMKLATRVNADPIRVLRAYTGKKYSGSTLELLEPNHTALIYPYLLDNSKLVPEVVDGKLKYTNFEEAMVKLEEELC